MRVSIVISALLLALGTSLANAQVMVLREISLDTYTSSLNDLSDNPVMEFTEQGPAPTGPGRGAGDVIMLNNTVLDYYTGQPKGVMHGSCLTVSHGEERYVGPPVLGAGGPFNAACQMAYQLPGGQIVANGNLDLNAMELDVVQSLPITGGTGIYSRARGSLTIVQDPPGQPITYKVVINVTPW